MKILEMVNVIPCEKCHRQVLTYNKSQYYMARWLVPVPNACYVLQKSLVSSDKGWTKFLPCSGQGWDEGPRGRITPNTPSSISKS